MSEHNTLLPTPTLDSLFIADPIRAFLLEHVQHSSFGLGVVIGEKSETRTAILYALIQLLAEQPHPCRTKMIMKDEVFALPRARVSHVFERPLPEDPSSDMLAEVTSQEGAPEAVLVREGASYADTLRAVLRVDPDVVTVDEVEDANTFLLVGTAAATRLVYGGVSNLSDFPAIDIQKETGLISGFLSFTVHYYAVPACSQTEAGHVLSAEERALLQTSGVDPTLFSETTIFFHDIGEKEKNVVPLCALYVPENGLGASELDMQPRHTFLQDAIEKARKGIISFETLIAVAQNMGGI